MAARKNREKIKEGKKQDENSKTGIVSPKYAHYTDSEKDCSKQPADSRAVIFRYLSLVFVLGMHDLIL